MTDEADDDFGPDDEDDPDLLDCSMGPNGQCGQAGSEHCDFACPIMAEWRRNRRRKASSTSRG